MNYGVIDAFNRSERPYTYLASANKDGIGTILARELTGDLCFNNISQVTFKVNKYEDEEVTPNYSQIENLMLVQLTNIGWFQITHINKKGDGNNEYIEVTCASLENEATTKTLTSFGQLGVSTDEQGGLDRYKLYDLVDIDHSIIHIWLQKMPSWNVGYIDPEITSEYRTFTNDEVGAYSFLVNDCSETFQCIFQFNTDEQTINAYKIENIGANTSIYLSYDNLVKTTKLEADYSDIKTVYTVAGGDDNGTTLGIIEVNPTGSNQIFNYSYYKSKMSAALQLKLDAFEIEYNSRLNDFTPAIDTLKTLLEELNNLNNKLPSEPTSTNWSEYGLKELNVKYDIYNNNMAIYISSSPSIYHTNYVLREAVNSEIIVRKSQIVTKEIQIANQKQLCESLTLNLQEYLGNTLYKELSRYYHEDTFTDDTFVITKDMSDSDALQMKRDLLLMAQTDLSKRCKPSYSLEVDALNFTVIPEFKVYTDQLQLGNIMTLDFGDGILVESRLLKIHINWDAPADFSMTFSSKNRLDGYDYQLAEIQSQANGVTTAYNISGTGWNAAKNNTSTFNQYMGATLDLARQKLQSSSDQEFLADSTGTKWRKKSGDSYSPNQMWGVGNGLYLTQDNWNSVSMAIGEGIYNSQTVYGIWAPLLCGSLILGNQLAISNEAGNFTITNNGFTATAIVGANTYSAGINPSTPSEIINVKVNGVNKFYVDTTNSRLIMNGEINATNGTLGNLTVTGTLTGGNINGTNIYSSTINSATINGGSILGAYIYSSATIGGVTVTTTIQDGRISTNGNIDVTAISGTNHTSISAALITVIGSSTSYLSATELSVSNITCSTINNSLIAGTIITSSNKNSYTYPPTSHSHDSLYDNGYELNWVGNSCLFAWSGQDLGQSSYRWGGIYLSTAPNVSSDRNLKHDIETLPEVYKNIILNLRPVRFKYNDGKSDRYHTGFISQEVEEVMKSLGLDSKEFAAFIKAPVYAVIDKSGSYDTSSEITGYIYMLRHEELISPIVDLVQELKAKSDNFENRLKVLENH